MDTNFLHILHFNDVYNVEEQKQEPVGGAARFTTALKSHGAGQHSIVLFSGDCLSPSYISNITYGQHIPSIMNKMYIQCSLFGNHEFDYGMNNFNECMNQCNFPWINSNVYDKELNELLGTKLSYKIIDYNNDIKIGIIGLIEKEWIEVIPCFTTSIIDVKDIIVTSRQLGTYLKIQKKCHFVIVLTHMRWFNDRLLAMNVPEIDLILEKKLDKPLGRIETDFDVRSNSVRLKESNIGNFICDIVLTAIEADCVLFNTGTLRGDRIFKAGLFTLRDLMTILPYLDKLSVIEITGSQLIEALENSVSEYPKSEG
uniref:Trifunctional nucleotide phosphoesterase protein YfkN n=1 Tax=Schistosoma haematobium TaxID=6185 RepID=A0A095A566_SCHHA